MTPEGAVLCTLGVETLADGSRRVALGVGDTNLSLSPEEAREMASDLIRFALEVEDGGQSQDTIGGWPVARVAPGESDS